MVAVPPINLITLSLSLLGRKCPVTVLYCFTLTLKLKSSFTNWLSEKITFPFESDCCERVSPLGHEYPTTSGHSTTCSTITVASEIGLAVRISKIANSICPALPVDGGAGMGLGVSIG